MSAESLRELLAKMRYDLTALQARLTDAVKAVDALGPAAPRPSSPVCSVCELGGGLHTAGCSCAPSGALPKAGDG